MKFNGSEKQNKWAAKILESAKLTPRQVDNLLRWAGPTMHSQKVMDVTIVIENRQNLADYANSLNEFYGLADKKHDVANEAVEVLRTKIEEEINNA